MAMTIGNTTYDDVDVKSDADGTRLSAALHMSPALRKDDLSAILDEFARLAHGTLDFRVINAPDYGRADIYDRRGRSRTPYRQLAPMTNLAGKREWIFYEQLDIWGPDEAWRYECYDKFTPYLCTTSVRDDDGAVMYDARQTRYDDVFATDAFADIIPGFDPNLDIGVYLVEETNSGVFLPVTEDSVVLWDFADDGDAIVNRLNVESRFVVEGRQRQRAIVNGDMYMHLLPDAASRARYRRQCLDAEIARDENLLARALRGEDMHEELAQVAAQTAPLVDPR